MALLTVENLSFSYPMQAKKALDGISFSLNRGDFLCVIGETGSGKSTLLQMLKRALCPVGAQSGTICINGQPLSALSDRTEAKTVGFVMQRPEQQLVTDKVYHELAFGPESLGMPADEIRRRTAETACYFGIEDRFERDTATLSGGQKQLLNLASVMVMQPDILILDEPTAQLDPIAAADFIATLTRLNRNMAQTIIIVEHRLEEILPVSSHVLALENGKLLAFGETRQTVSALRAHERLSAAMPAAVRLYGAFPIAGECPLEEREGRIFLERHFDNTVRRIAEPDKPTHTDGRKKTPALEMAGVYFRYERHGDDILRGLDLTVSDGECFCILGANGSGKSTALTVAAGLHRPYTGAVRVFGKKTSAYAGSSLYAGCLSMLPQDVGTVFLKNSVAEELQDAGIGAGNIDLPFDFSPLSDRHPYDLSGGEQQLLALAKALAAKPRLLLLDEPTKGLDAYAKARLLSVLSKLKQDGMTLLIVSHDTEFAAACADRCALFFRGQLVSVDTARRFFSESSFYTTAVSRMTRGFFDDAVTLDDAVSLCGQNGRRG